VNILDAYQRTPLHYACEKRFFFSIIYLLDKWVHYDVVDAEGNTPLAICLKHRNLNQAAMIMKRGVGYGCVVEEGKTYSYLQYALKRLSVGICFMLIEHGYPRERAMEEAEGGIREILVRKYGK
jgi:ankyrin repeat protein